MEQIIEDLTATNLSAGIYQQISWKNVSLRFLFWLIALINHLKLTHSRTAWKKQFLFQFSKRVILLIRRAATQLAYYSCSLRFLENWFINHSQPILSSIPAGNYMFKVNNRNTRTRFEICSKLTIKTPERRHFIVNFEHIPHFVLVFLLLTLSRQILAGILSDFLLHSWQKSLDQRRFVGTILMDLSKK